MYVFIYIYIFTIKLFISIEDENTLIIRKFVKFKNKTFLVVNHNIEIS